MKTNAIQGNAPLARSLVAVVSAALGILGLAYSEFAPLGQVITAGTAARQAWLFGSASLLLLASPLCFVPTVLPSVLIVGSPARNGRRRRAINGRSWSSICY